MTGEADAPIDYAAARALAEQLGPPRPSRASRCKGAREVLGMISGLPGGEEAMYEPLRRDLARVSRASGVSREQLLALAAAGRRWPKVPPRATAREAKMPEGYSISTPHPGAGRPAGAAFLLYRQGDDVRQVVDFDNLDQVEAVGRAMVEWAARRKAAGS